MQILALTDSSFTPMPYVPLLTILLSNDAC